MEKNTFIPIQMKKPRQTPRLSSLKSIAAWFGRLTNLSGVL